MLMKALLNIKLQNKSLPSPCGEKPSMTHECHSAAIYTALLTRQSRVGCQLFHVSTLFWPPCSLVLFIGAVDPAKPCDSVPTRSHVQHEEQEVRCDMQAIANSAALISCGGSQWVVATGE